MFKRLTKAVIIAVAIALAGVTTPVAAGDDLKHIGIGTGLGILTSIMQGKPLTLERTISTAAGAAIGSQIGDGSGSAVAATLGGIAGDTLMQHSRQMFARATPSTAAVTLPAPTLASVVGAPAVAAHNMTVPVQSGITLNVSAGRPEACEGSGVTRHCVPVNIRRGNALLLTDGATVWSCMGASGALDCTRVR